MNDNEKYFEEFVKDIRFDDSVDLKHRDLLESKLLKAYPRHRLQPTGHTVRVWRTIMNSRIPRLAAAAAIIFAAFLTLNFFDKTSGVVWAEVIKRLEDIKTVAYKINADIKGMSGSPEGSVIATTQDVMVSYELNAVRIDTSMQTPRGPVNTKTYILFEDRVLLTLMPFQKKYIEVSISDEHMKKLEKEKGDPVTLLSAMLEHDYVELGRKEINGVMTWGIEVSDPKLGPKMGSLISSGMFDEMIVQLWVDEKNQLPIRINATGSSEDGKASMETVYDNFQWDIEIESSTLEPMIPDDFELLAQTTWESGNEGEVIIEVLQLFLEFADGVYPPSLNAMTVANAIAPALKKKFPQKPGKEVLERLIKVDMVGRMYTILEKDGKDPAYYGDKVTVEFGEAVLFRWKIGDDTYRVVFGDLSTEDVSAEELMELESAPLNSKPFAIKPQPADGKTVGTPLEQLELAWMPGAYATRHQVYFGTNPDELTLLTEVTEPKLSELPALERENVYYWRVDEVQPDGSIVTGDVWSFSSGRIVGFWKLNEGSGSAALDYSGNERNGKLTNMAQDQWTEDGLYFDGIDDFVSAPVLNLYSNTVTITAWLKRDGDQAKPDTGLVFCRSERTGAGLSLGHYINPEGRWIPNNRLAYNWNNNENAWRWTTDLLLPDNKWVFAALVLEPDRATLYLGEDEILKSAVNNTRHRMEEFESPITIGDDDHFDPPGMNRHFKGSISDVRVYDYSLNADEVAAIYESAMATLTE